MKKALHNTKSSVKLRKSEYRDEWYLYIESYPVFVPGKDKPQRVREYVNRVITTPIWDKKRTARTDSDGNSTYKPKRDVNGIIMCKSPIDQESCIYADNIRAIRQKEYDGHGVTKDISLAIEFYKKALDKNPSYELARNALNRYQPKEPNPSQPIPSDETTAPNTKTDEGITIDASGTGFIIDKRGYLATNNHVTKGARGIYVCLQIDGIWKSYNAVLVKNDPTNDLSIIRIEDTTFKPFSSMPYNFTTDVEEVASEIYTLGYPQVHIMGTEVKYTTGAINSKSGVQGDPTHYQISAHIDHGNSGGPMFNSKGTIIGITDSGLDKAEFGDVNYAIKSSYLKSLVDALPVKLELPHDTSIEKLSRVEQIKVLSKFTALILIDLP